MYFFILLVIILFCIVLNTKCEYFTQDIQNETNDLNKLFQSYIDKQNTEKSIGLNEMYNTANKYVYYDKYPLQDILKQYAMQKLDVIFSESKEFSGSQISIVKDMYDIYTYDKDDKRYILFKMDIKNETRKWVKVLNFYVILNNLSKIVNGNLMKEDVIGNIILQSIFIDINNFAYSAFDKNDKYYRIKNSLGLMDPFLTSGKDMQITDEMRSDFEKKLEMQVINDKNI